MMSLASLLSIKVTSPITHMVSSAVRGVAASVLGVWLFGDIISGCVIFAFMCHVTAFLCFRSLRAASCFFLVDKIYNLHSLLQWPCLLDCNHSSRVHLLHMGETRRISAKSEGWKQVQPCPAGRFRSWKRVWLKT
jgi:hypothetical protein